MPKLIAELIRLYLPTGGLPREVLEQHASGRKTVSASLVAEDGTMRAMVIPFDKLSDGDGAQHWSLLCEVANALQVELGLPAPAVSITGDKGFALWLSLETPVPVALVQQFMALLRAAHFAHLDMAADAVTAPVELPPCVHQGTGRWAAFINPGLGASFAEESGLEMPPPLAGQVALLEHLESISEKKFLHALKVLQHSQGEVEEVEQVPQARSSAPNALLLKDATLEDIVKHLHSLNIEPTFRHLIRK